MATDLARGETAADLGLPPDGRTRLMVGTRLSEAIVGLRSIRQLGNPHVDTEWFRDSLRWSVSDGDLVTTLCAAPAGPPEFLLDCLSAAHPWPDELYDLLAVDEATVRRGLRRSFRDRVPAVVQVEFDDHREGLAAVIRQLDVYVSTILDPLWLRVSMAVSGDVERIKEVLGPRLETKAVETLPVVVPTVFGLSTETYPWRGSSLVSVPVTQPESVLTASRLPRAPVATLIGGSRAAILFALDDAMTVRDLARVTGQRNGSLLHHLRVLCQTNLVAEVTAQQSSEFRRTRIGDLLIDADVTTRRGLAGSSG